MKQLVDSGFAGEIKTVEATFSYYNLEEICGETWRNCARSCPGGPLMQLGVHHADNLPYLFGPPDRIFGEIMSCPENSNVPAGGRLLLKFKNGITGSITADYATAPELFSIYARGTAGEIRVDGEEQLSIIDADGKRAAETVAGTHSVADQLSEFCRCIETREAPETDGLVGLKALNIILTGLEAAGQNKALPVEEIILG
jgi:predicted dehydrogenase